TAFRRQGQEEGLGAFRLDHAAARRLDLDHAGGMIAPALRILGEVDDLGGVERPAVDADFADHAAEVFAGAFRPADPEIAAPAAVLGGARGAEPAVDVQLPRRAAFLDRADVLPARPCRAPREVPGAAEHPAALSVDPDAVPGLRVAGLGHDPSP